MDALQPVPGRHLRKNQKQILAMFRAAMAQAGLEFLDRSTGSGRGTASGTRDGAPVIELDYTFGTSGIDAIIRDLRRGDEVSAPGLYTDTTGIMGALRRVLGLPEE